MKATENPFAVDLRPIDLSPILELSESLLGALGHLERERANCGFGLLSAALFSRAGIAAAELEAAVKVAGYRENGLPSGPIKKFLAFAAVGRAALTLRLEGSLFKAGEIDELPDLRAQRDMLAHAVELLREAVPPKAKRRASTARAGRIDADQVAELWLKFLESNPSKVTQLGFCRWWFKGDETKAQSLRRRLPDLRRKSETLRTYLAAYDGKIKPSGVPCDRRQNKQRGT